MVAAHPLPRTTRSHDPRSEDRKKSTEVEIEVPGTPEEVWQAIATGPGFTSWFVPAEIEERVGGATSFHFGEGMDDPAP